MFTRFKTWLAGHGPVPEHEDYQHVEALATTSDDQLEIAKLLYLGSTPWEELAGTFRASLVNDATDLLEAYDILVNTQPNVLNKLNELHQRDLAGTEHEQDHTHG